MSYTQLKNEIKKAAGKTFSEARNQHPNDHFFAYVLSTMDDHKSIKAIVNSEESHHKIEANTINPYLKWSPTEWEYEYSGEKYFKVVDQLLSELSSNIEHENHCQKVYEAMRGALEELDDDEFFCNGSDRESIYIFITVDDSKNSAKYEEESSRYLNPTETHNIFMDRYEALDGKEFEHKKNAKLLKDGVEEGIRALQTFVDEYPEEQIYSITLYVDNDVSSAYMCVNTIEGLKRICPKLEQDSDFYYYKYNPAEWERRLRYPLNKTNELLEVNYELQNESNNIKFEKIHSLTDYLNRVKIAVCKPELLDQIVVFVNIGDAYEFEIDEILKSAKQFNSDYATKEIFKYYNQNLQ